MEDTAILTFSEDVVVSEEVLIIVSQEDMESSLFHDFTPEQDSSNHQEEDEYPLLRSAQDQSFQ